MAKIIIHTETKVIKRITTDPNPQLNLGESIIDLGDETMDIGRKDDGDGTFIYWKLDQNNQKIPATLLEVDLAGVDSELEQKKKQEKIDLMNTIIDSIATGSRTINEQLILLRQYFQVLKDLRK